MFSSNSLALTQVLYPPLVAACPNLLDPKGRAKWFAWEKKKGTSQDDAKMAYIA